jgi:chromosome segregation ATPase
MLSRLPRRLVMVSHRRRWPVLAAAVLLGVLCLWAAADLLRVQRDWAFAVLSACLPPSSSRPTAMRRSLRAVAWAVVFCCGLNKARPHSSTASFKWNVAGLSAVSAVSAGLRMRRVHELAESVPRLQADVQTLAAKESELRSLAAQLDASHARLDNESRRTERLKAQVASTAKERARQQQLEARALQAEAANQALASDAEALRREHKCELWVLEERLDALRKRLAAAGEALKREKAEGRRAAGLCAALQLECDAAKEMLERAQRYAEAEIASLSSKLARV